MPSGERSIRVIITPYDGDANPYLKLLATSLETAGLQVSLAWLYHLPLWSAVLKCGWPDVIHLQWHHRYFTVRKWPWVGWAILRTVLFYLQWLTLYLLGVRFVWTVHNIVNHEKHQAGWELLACRLLSRLADSIIVHCAAARPVVAAAYRVAPERLCVVPIGHYVDWYPPAPAREEARRTLGLPDDVRVFLFYGLIRKYKGLDRLLEAFADLQEEKTRLILVGKPFSESLGHLLSVQAASDPRVMVHFEFITNDHLITYLSACDLVVLPYVDSLASSAAVLAASYGRPVLAPRRGCMGELPAEAAILYDPEMPDGLQMALEHALSAPLMAMGSAAKSYIEQFPWSLVAARTLMVYQSVLGHGRYEGAMQNRPGDILL